MPRLLPDKRIGYREIVQEFRTAPPSTAAYAAGVLLQKAGVVPENVIWFLWAMTDAERGALQDALSDIMLAQGH